MIASCPVAGTSTAPARGPSDQPVRSMTPGTDPGSWRYTAERASRRVVVVAVLISASVHAGLIFGFRHSTKKPVAPKTEHVIALTLAMPELKDLEEPETITNDDGVKPEELSIPVPMQADLPRLPEPNDFVQKLDFSSLIERPDVDQMKVFSIPEHMRRGGNLAEGLGNIFNLADLDREPVPTYQPAPIVPAALRRDGISGHVRVEFIVDSVGLVHNPTVVESTDPRFDDAAVIAVSRWKFKPGMKGGRKVATRMAVPIVFTIADVIE